MRSAQEKPLGGLPRDKTSQVGNVADASAIDGDTGPVIGEATRDAMWLTRPCSTARIAVFVTSAAQSSCAAIATPSTKF